MIILTGGFSNKSFFINIIFISYKFFWAILNLFSWNLNTFTNHKDQVCFLLICSFSTCCFVIILCINALHLFIIFTSCKHTGWACFLFYCFATILCNKTLHHLYLDRFIKTNSFLYQFPRWSLNFLNIRFTSAEVRMSKLSKVWYKI